MKQALYMCVLYIFSRPMCKLNHLPFVTSPGTTPTCRASTPVCLNSFRSRNR